MEKAITIPESFYQFADVLIDSYFIIDLEHNIVDFNKTFHSILPRQAARNLKGKKCYDVLKLDICQANCIARECWKQDRSVRLDEINGRVATEEQQFRFILCAIPIRNNNGELIGAMEMQRNVTDEAMVQVKYQQLMDFQSAKQKKLEDDLQERTQQLLEASRKLQAARHDLIRAKTELFG